MIVADLTPMRSVSFSDGVATAGAGARVGDVYTVLAEHGRTIPAGRTSSVGIAGLTLGGGFGILGRKYGLTCDQLLAAQVVLADGRVVECDDRHDHELFWALRGAGCGNFGVVTSLSFRTVRMPAATAFSMTWPCSLTAAVIDAWQVWQTAGPDDLTSSLLVKADADGCSPTANLVGIMLGTQVHARELLSELTVRVGARPLPAYCMPFREAKRHPAFTGSEWQQAAAPHVSASARTANRSEFFRRPLPRQAIAALVENLIAERPPDQSRGLYFTSWGGAYNRVREDATAFVHRNETFLLKYEVSVGSRAGWNDGQRWLARCADSIRPHGTGGVYPNFPDPSLTDWAYAYYGVNYERLQRVKQEYDPMSFFCFPQAIEVP
jgi:FAD/FMN-containing dehydrogenase